MKLCRTIGLSIALLALGTLAAPASAAIVLVDGPGWNLSFDDDWDASPASVRTFSASLGGSQVTFTTATNWTASDADSGVLTVPTLIRTSSFTLTADPGYTLAGLQFRADGTYAFGSATGHVLGGASIATPLGSGNDSFDTGSGSGPWTASPAGLVFAPGTTSVNGLLTVVVSANKLGGTGSLALGATDAVLTVAAVPEPAEWALMLAGLGMVGWVVRKRSRERR